MCRNQRSRKDMMHSQKERFDQKGETCLKRFEMIAVIKHHKIKMNIFIPYMSKG